MPKPTKMAVPEFDKWRLDQESRGLTATVAGLHKALDHNHENLLAIHMEQELMKARLSDVEGAQARLQILLKAIQKDLPAITKNCPNVLAVAANIAIEEGGLDKD